VTICAEASKAQSGGFGVWQEGLRFYPPLEFFVQTFDGVRRADRPPLARFVQAVKALMPPARVHRNFFAHRE
jgi:hypothetical protein